MIASLTDVKVEIPGTNGLLEYWERSLFLKVWSTGLLLLGEIPTGVLGEIPKGLEYWERSLLEYWTTVVSFPLPGCLVPGGGGIPAQSGYPEHGPRA